MADPVSIQSPSQSQPLLKMTNVSKSFPGVRALADVNLDLYPGEVLALLGENGAGKSTLIKILGGVHAPDTGSIEIDGQKIQIDSPTSSQDAGVGIIFQEFNLIPALTARENIFLGQENSALSWIATSQERETARSLFERIGVQVDPSALCRDLTVAQQQVVEIAKALALKARLSAASLSSPVRASRESAAGFFIINAICFESFIKSCFESFPDAFTNPFWELPFS